MNAITSSHARQNWAETIESAKREPILITDHGRATVAVMDAELAKLALHVLEDSRDIELAVARLEKVDAGERAYTMAEIKAELFNLVDKITES